MNSQVQPMVTLPRNILVSVDAGPLTDHAIAQALELAQRFEARVELLHAVAVSTHPWSLVTASSDTAATSERLAKVKARLVDYVGALATSAHGGSERPEALLNVVAGRPSQVVLDRAREISADLIVLGALRRRAGVDFGGTARAVLAGSKCPVWVQPGPVRKIERILVPVDLSDESLLALATACEMAPRFGARVTAISVFDLTSLTTPDWDGFKIAVDAVRASSLAAFEQAMKAFDWRGVERDTAFVDGMPTAEILERARNADLVVMGTHGRGGLASVLLGSTAYAVLKAATRPVMVVRKPGRTFAA